MAQQGIGSDQVDDLSLTNADISNTAGIEEDKLAFDNATGHDHDTVGTPTPAVLVVRQAKVTQSSTPNLFVQIAPATGVNFPDIISPAIAQQQINFGPILPTGANKRIDLLHVDKNGLVQLLQGTPTAGTPVPPRHDGTFPLAEIGPLLSTTTAITTSLIKDVRPFLAANPSIEAQQTGVSQGFIHTVNAGTNMTVSVTNGVATLASTVTPTPPAADASTTVKGVTKLSVAPVSATNPIALGANDPAVALAQGAFQKDGSTPMTGDINMNGNDIVNVPTISSSGALTLTAGLNTDLSLTTSGTGKVEVDSASAFRLPSTVDIPPNPDVGDIWYAPGQDSVFVRTTTGPVELALAQTGLISLTVNEILGDPSFPPTPGTVGEHATLDFIDDFTNDHGIRFSFQIPEDAVVLQPIKIRIAFTMSSAGAGTVQLNYDYKVVEQGATLILGSPTGSGSTGLVVDTSANVFEYDDTIQIPAVDLIERGEISVRLFRASSGGFDTRSGTWRLLGLAILYTKKDITGLGNTVQVTDEVTDLGPVSRLIFQGNQVSVGVASGEATVTISSASANDASATVKGVTKLSVAPVLSTNPIAVGDNDPRLPTTAEKAALAGSFNPPGASNKYVTQMDPAVMTVNQQNAVVGTFGTPSATNRFVTSTDPRVPTQSENDALAGSFGSPSSSNTFVTSSDPRVPLQTENDALLGTSGTPSTTNRYITDADTRVPTQSENDALVGLGTASPSSSNRYILSDYVNLPSAAEKAAMAGTSGTPGAANKYVTANDTAFVKTDGTRSFVATVSGIDPTSSTHLATKNYVDAQASALGGQYAAHVQDLSALRAVPESQRVDKQIRLVENEGALYRFDQQASGGGEPPNAGPGQWFRVQGATQAHNSLTGLQGGTLNEFYHLDVTQLNQLTSGGVTAIHNHDHGALAGLADDDHLQYVLVNGTRAFTGNQSFGNFQATNFRLENLGADPAFNAAHEGRVVWRTDIERARVNDGEGYVDLTGITGALVAGRLAIASSAVTVTDDPNLTYDILTDVLILGGSSTTKMVHAVGNLIDTDMAYSLTATVDPNSSTHVVTKWLADLNGTTGQTILNDVRLVNTGSPSTNANIGLRVLTDGTTANVLSLGAIGGGLGSLAVFGAATAATGGLSVGGYFEAIPMDGTTMGVVGKSTAAGGVADLVGILGFSGTSGGTAAAGHFTLDGTPSFVSAALVADNGAEAVPSLIIRDNNVTVFEVLDGGNTNFTNKQATNFRVENLSADPTFDAGHEGRVLWRTDIEKLRINDGEGYIDIGGSGFIDGTLTTPKIPYATDSNTLADSGFSWNAGLSQGAVSGGFNQAAGTVLASTDGYSFSATYNSSGTTPELPWRIIVTSAGSTALVQTAARVDLQGSYSGANRTEAMSLLNVAESTGSDFGFVTSLAGNVGLHSQAAPGGSTACLAVGVYGVTTSVDDGSDAVGVIGHGAGTTSGTYNIGVYGRGRVAGSADSVGGYFEISNNAARGATFNAALVANNRLSTSPVFIAADNNTEVFSIQDGGQVISSTNNGVSFRNSSGTEGLCVYPIRRTVTVVGPTELSIDDGNSIFLPALADGETWLYEFYVVARGTSGTDDNESAGYRGWALIERTGSTTALVGSNVETLAEEESTWDLTVVADDTNERLAIKFTGTASNTVQVAGWANAVKVS